MSEADKIIESLKNSGRKVEEFYTGNKGSDKNVGSIEDDVKRCNELIKVEHANWIGISNQLAISHILAEREQMLKERDVANDSVIAHKFAVMQQQLEQKDKQIQELEELEKANRQLDLDYVEENFIPKQKVMDKIEELIIDNRYYDKFLESRDIQYTIDILREILEGGK